MGIRLLNPHHAFRQSLSLQTVFVSTFSLTSVYDDPVLLLLKDAPTVEQCHGNDVPLVPKAQLLGALDILGHFVAWKRSSQQRQQ